MSRVSGKPYFVYVLWSERGRRFYIGISEDAPRRLHQHNHAPTGWTARFRPWALVHTERFDDYRAARSREIELKSQKAGWGFFRQTGLDPSLFVHRPTNSGS